MSLKYEIFNPKVDRPLSQLTRVESRKAYEWFIENIDSRLKQLELITSFKGIALDFSEKSLKEIDQWFFDRAKVDFDECLNSVSPEVFSICNDLGMYVSEMLIRLPGNISWEFCTKGKKNISYQRSVISGFSNVKNKNFNIDIDLLLCRYAHRILKGGEQESGLILNIYKEARSFI